MVDELSTLERQAFDLKRKSVTGNLLKIKKRSLLFALTEKLSCDFDNLDHFYLNDGIFLVVDYLALYRVQIHNAMTSPTFAYLLLVGENLCLVESVDTDVQICHRK